MTKKKCEEADCDATATIKTRLRRYLCMEHGVIEEPLKPGEVPEPAEQHLDGWDKKEA